MEENIYVALFFCSLVLLKHYLRRRLDIKIHQDDRNPVTTIVTENSENDRIDGCKSFHFNSKCKIWIKFIITFYWWIILYLFLMFELLNKDFLIIVVKYSKSNSIDNYNLLKREEKKRSKMTPIYKSLVDWWNT